MTTVSPVPAGSFGSAGSIASTGSSGSVGDRISPLRLTLHQWSALTVVWLWFTVKFGIVEQLYRPPGAFATAALPAMALMVLVIAPRGTIGRIPVSVPLLAVLCWTAMSAAWSRDPVFSQFQIRNEIPVLLMVLAVIATLPTEVVRQGLCWMYYGVTMLSLATSLTRPESQVAPKGAELDEGELIGWRGLFDHKNGLGVFLVLGMIAILAFERRRPLRILGALLAAACVVGSRSATAASGFMVALIVWIWVGLLNRSTNQRDRALFGLVSIAMAIMAVFVGLGLMPAFLDLYGKDFTFSGRTIIWRESMEVVEDNPIIGVGYGGVWHDIQGPLTSGLHRQIGFNAAHAHNGAIEVLMETGLIGLVLFVVFFASVVRKAASLLETPARMTARWALACCAGVAFMGIGEVLFQGSMLGFLAIIWMVVARAQQDVQADTSLPIETRLGAGRR
ncbi:MAG: O-antigen ligase family protein [Actinomycetes bacterium]|uniref:Unannotated protein n=1 Tax=freshwater metagenome TaxID=449393 RepID=A0A6J6CXB1_9ZZZZ|nr:hypothetical protein [Actinomycetota bacterium]